MKLYWSPRSPFVRKVMVCAHELGLDHRIETVYALVSPSQVNAEVLRVNPIGRIPALETENGTVLYDSNVICEYFDVELGSSRLFPQERPQRWQTLKRLALADGMLETGVMWRAERTKPAPQQSSDFFLACDRKITQALAAAEEDASSLRHDGFDIGEIGIACALGYLDFRFVELDWGARCPRAAKWFETFNARESMQKTTPRQEQ